MGKKSKKNLDDDWEKDFDALDENGELKEQAETTITGKNSSP
jgi:hypothetical protein